jgi:hypothetical protein
MAGKYMKKCSPSLAFREMQLTMTMTLRFHLTPSDWQPSRKQTRNAGEDVDGEEPQTLLVEV